MNFEELAVEYCDANVFNEDTRETMIRIGRLFDIRTLCPVENYSLKDVTVFKRVTLSKAKTISYNGYLRYLRILGDYAVDQNYCESNFFRKVKTGPVPRGAAKSLLDNDLWQLFSHIRDHSNRYKPIWFWESIIKTLYFTGMRRRQVVSLKVGDINFESSIICLSYEGSKTLRQWTIPIHPILVDVFKEVIEHSELALGRPLNADETIFNICRHHPRYKPCQRFADRMPSRAITDFFKRINKATGLSIGAHKFRHTVATKLCNPQEGDPDIFAVQQILGHTMISTTRGYVSMSESRLAKVLGEINLPDLAKKVLTR